jgi:hypothetical protein
MTRQPDFSTTRRAGGARVLERLATGVAVLAVALALVSAWRAHEEARQASERLAAVRGEVSASSSRLHALVAASDASLERRARAEAARDGSPTRIVADLAAVLPRAARLERLSIEYGRDVSLQMQVVARDASAWDSLLERLERAPRFQGVEPGPEDREGEVRSVVKARWVGGEVR